MIHPLSPMGPYLSPHRVPPCRCIFPHPTPRLNPYPQIEFEPRFVDDARQFLLKLAPPYYPWLHNDVDNRVGPPDWPGGDEAWRTFREGEAPNAHSHLIAMVVGTSESIPVHNGALAIGKYQNIIVVRLIACACVLVSICHPSRRPSSPIGKQVEADGAHQKKRTIVVQLTGEK